MNRNVDEAGRPTAGTTKLAVIRDIVTESTETFTIQLSSATGETLSRSSATATILDDDNVSVPPPSVTQPVTPSTVTFSKRDDWGAGFVMDVKIKNVTAATMNGWRLEFDLAADIVNIWNAVIVSHVGTHYVIQMAPWNGTISPGGEVTFGFQASGTGRAPTNVKLNGAPV